MRSWPNQDVALDRAGITIFQDITFLAAGPASERSRSATSKRGEVCMLILVGKATPNEQTGDVELYLQPFRQMWQRQGQFVYAWSFNPDKRAMALLQQHIDNQEDIFLYLPVDGRHATLRMHIMDYSHSRDGIATCPTAWNMYCIPELQGPQDWGVHIWFLVDAIEELPQPVDLKTFAPAFPDKYQSWGRNYFAFLRGN
jgi:hypothetical protein